MQSQSCNVPKISSSLYKWNYLSWSLTSVPPYSGRSTTSPSLKATGMSFPSRSRAPGPTATTFPEFNLEVFSGRWMPVLVLEGRTIFSTTILFSDDSSLLAIAVRIVSNVYACRRNFTDTCLIFNLPTRHRHGSFVNKCGFFFTIFLPTQNRHVDISPTRVCFSVCRNPTQNRHLEPGLGGGRTKLLIKVRSKLYIINIR